MNRYISLFIILLCLPIILWGVCSILPTFDDYTTLQSPQFTSPWSTQLLPNDSFWRPWDYLFGCFLGRHTDMFPGLNHILIILGHTVNTLLIFAICRKLSINSLATNIAIFFFFFSPATLGTTLAVDGLNQTYAQFFGLLAVYCYLYGGKILWLWPFFVILGALAKENGLAWAIIPPLISYAFRKAKNKIIVKHITIGLLIAIVYFVARITLRVSGSINNEYISLTFLDHIKDFIQLLCYTWLPIDYMSLVFAPQRNWLLALLTVILAMPFLFWLIKIVLPLLKKRTVIVLILCFFILAAPHLLTLVSIMHNYAALSLAALLVAVIIQNINLKTYRMTIATFVLFLIAAIITDIHHFLGAREGGLLSKQLATEAIIKTEKKVKRAYCINIDNNEPKYSSFGVPSIDAFAWGLSVRHYTSYQWPEEINDTLISAENKEKATTIAKHALNNGADCVWIVDGKHIVVVK